MAIKSVVKDLIKPLMGSGYYSSRSYAQEGEDLVLSRIFEGRGFGFYVDIGCHHPFRFSNTYLFYRRGWSGICMDPLPGTVDGFNRWRPRDIAVEVGIAEDAGSMKYYMFNEPALNTFDKHLAVERDGFRAYKIIATKDVQLLPLREVLKSKLPEKVSRIDFFSVDVEGLDLAVLQSNDWELYRPRVVVAECLKSDLYSLLDDPVTHYLSGVGYFPYAKTGNSVIFVERDQSADTN